MTLQETIEKWDKEIKSHTLGDWYQKSFIIRILEDFKAVQEPKPYDFICPNSGEKFNNGDECFIVWNDRLDKEPAFYTFDSDVVKSQSAAYFHTKESALEWSKKKFEGEEEGIEGYSEVEKPPIGLKPKHIHEEQRMSEILEAIKRYLEPSKRLKIPQEWIDEYNELCSKLPNKE